MRNRFFATFSKDHQVELARGRMKPTATMVAVYLGARSGLLRHQYKTALVEGADQRDLDSLRTEIDMVAALLDVLKNSEEL